MRLLDVAVLSLATWRIASLLSWEEGPFDVFQRFRDWLGLIRDDAGRVLDDCSPMARMVGCVWCLSLWLAIGWGAAYALTPLVVLWGALPFALSAAACIVELAVKRDER